MKRLISLLLATTLIFAGIANASAASTLTLNLKKTPGLGEPKVTLYGQIKPAKSNVPVKIEVYLSGKWNRTSIATKTKLGGSWKIEVISTVLAGRAQYRAVAATNIYSNTRTLVIDPETNISTVDPALLIALSGPGNRVHGADISKWQHPGGKLIDFQKMYQAGLRFVMIKASDALDSSDVDARKWLAQDVDAAQAAGLFTGFYHYAKLPNSTDEKTVITEAQTQAQKAIWRLASIGGYTERTLPYALDLENNCIQSVNSVCKRYATKKLVTLFATTWLRSVKEKTGRTPMLYSYSQFLENAITRSTELRSYPLWLAHYGINPADPLGQPGQKLSGCFVHSWTSSSCSSEWVVWQYTSCGVGSKYGIPSGRVDLNVFRGNVDAFIELSKGIWIPTESEMMPFNEATTMQFISANYSTSDQPAIFQLNVLRPSGMPVVTGSVKLLLPDASARIEQSAVRSKNGSFTLTVKGIPVGTWDATLQFMDQSGTHATAEMPIQIVMDRGTKPTPTVKPSPKPGTSSKAPADSCKNQIVN